MCNNQINNINTTQMIGSSIFACLVVVLFCLCINYLGPDPEFRFCKSGRCYCEHELVAEQETITEPRENKTRRRNRDIFSIVYLSMCFIMIFVQPVSAHLDNTTDSFPIDLKGHTLVIQNMTNSPFTLIFN